MKLKSDAQSALKSMKDEASDICYDAKVEEHAEVQYIVAH